MQSACIALRYLYVVVPGKLRARIFRPRDFLRLVQAGLASTPARLRQEPRTGDVGSGSAACLPKTVPARTCFSLMITRCCNAGERADVDCCNGAFSAIAPGCGSFGRCHAAYRSWWRWTPSAPSCGRWPLRLEPYGTPGIRTTHQPWPRLWLPMTPCTQDGAGSTTTAPSSADVAPIWPPRSAQQGRRSFSASSQIQ